MLLIFFTFALFASGILVNKMLLHFLPPTLFVGIRMLTAGLILFFYSIKRHRETFADIKKDWHILTGVALFTTFIPAILKAYALSHLPVAHMTLLGSIDPFVTAFYAYILWREKLSFGKICGILIGCLGIITSINLSVLTASGCFSLLWPQLAAIAAVSFSRFGWIMVQKQLRKNRYPPAQLNSIIMTESGIIALFAARWIDPHHIINIPSFGQFFFLLAYTVLIGNVIAYTLYGHILKHHNATFVSLAGFSLPVFAAIFANIFLGEPLTFNFFFSGTIIFIGLLVFYYDDIKKQRRQFLS